MKYLHYIFFEEYELEYQPSVKIRHSNMWLYACDMASLEFFKWLCDFGCKCANVPVLSVNRVSFNISRKFTIVAFYKDNQCLESASLEYVMKSYWKSHRNCAIPDLVKYLNLNMCTNQQFLCNPNFV